MKKFTVAVLIIGTFIFYSLLYNHSNAVALPGNVNNPSSSSSSSTRPSSNNGSTSGSSNAAGASSSNNGNTSGSSKSTGTYKDGSYTGSVADAQWGNLQVKAIIQGGKLTDVQFLQYPNDRNRSIRINESADPQLTSEAIQAQSAQVDVVSGATDSSEAFIQSLSDALSQAKA